MGEKAGEERKTMIDTLAWLAHILSAEHTVFVSEYVYSDEFVRTITDLLGHLPYTGSTRRSKSLPIGLACEQSWAVSGRIPQIEKSEPSLWLKTFVKQFARPTTLTWRSLLVASRSDLHDEKRYGRLPAGQ